MGLVSDYVKRKWSTTTHTSERTVEVADSSSGPTQILRNSPDRMSYLIVNLGDYDVYVSMDGHPSTTHGILLMSHGGSITSDIESDQEMVAYPMYAIADGGVSEVYIIETEAG